jgi:hypothetical protein
MAVADMGYNLAEHGDVFEKAAWRAFLRDEFPAYADVWAAYIVPLTRRPDDVHFKTDAELAEIGRGPADICHAQLHYTLFAHLVRGHALRTLPLETADMFIEAMVRLSAATDVADELLERVTHAGNYAPWKEGPLIREEWRKANQSPCREVRRYRNRLLHGRLLPSIWVYVDDPRSGVGVMRQGYRMVKIGREDDYVDWRAFVGGNRETRSAGSIEDFAMAEEVVQDAWTRVLTYLEAEWQRILLPAVSSGS